MKEPTKPKLLDFERGLSESNKGKGGKHRRYRKLVVLFAVCVGGGLLISKVVGVKVLSASAFKTFNSFYPYSWFHWKENEKNKFFGALLRKGFTGLWHKLRLV